eukprot:14941295-Heterocapsa_arctica.AAC.1
MRYLKRAHGVSVAWLHEIVKNESIELGYELSYRMCADIYSKGFTDGPKWIEVCDLINIVDPARLRGLIQHVAEVVAGSDDAIIGDKTQTPSPCGGDTQNFFVPSIKPLSAVPAINNDKPHTLSEIDRSALMIIIKDMSH